MAPPRRPEIVIGLDVGRSSHWACVVARDGEVLASKPVANRENALDSLFAEFPGALVVVDQVRNIGALGIPDALLLVAYPDPAIAAARALAAQRGFLACESTRSKNRLRSILLESCPEFGSLVDLSDAAELRLMAARGARRGKVDALVGSVGRLPGRTRPRSPPRTAR